MTSLRHSFQSCRTFSRPAARNLHRANCRSLRAPAFLSRGWCVSLNDLAAFRARVAAGLTPEQAVAVNDAALLVERSFTMREPGHQVSNHSTKLAHLSALSSRFGQRPIHERQELSRVRIAFRGDGNVFVG